jgi:hypothetical protein
VTVEDAMASLTEHWDDVISRLTPARGQELRNLIAAIGGEDHTGAVVGITQLLVGELPPEHPVRRALAKGYLYTRAQADWPTVRADLLTAAGAVLAGTPYAEPGNAQHDTSRLVADGEQTPEGILAEVTGRLLRAPALTEEEVRRRGGDPADPGLLWLDRPDGGRQWPSFQFAPDGGPLRVVRAVNTMLGAETDPLGVADWWLGANPWLDGRPSDLIGDIPDDVLLRAARAVIEEV